jgi:hypothetical protein
MQSRVKGTKTQTSKKEGKESKNPDTTEKRCCEEREEEKGKGRNPEWRRKGDKMGESDMELEEKNRKRMEKGIGKK